MKKMIAIIPTFNAEKWIETAVSSIFDQTYQNVTAICVDDNSSDSTLLILNGLKERFKNLIVLKNDKNMGVSFSRNKALQYIYINNLEDAYISFLDADDYLSYDNCYKEAIRKMESDGSDICFYEFTRFWEKEQIIKTLEFKEISFERMLLNCRDIKYFWYPTQGKTIDNFFVTEYIHGSVCRSVFKLSILKENNLKFDESMAFAEDQIFILNYLLNVNKISCLGKSCVMYRGWTKKHTYNPVCKSEIYLLQKQVEVLNKNNFYSAKIKSDLLAYLKVQAYFAIVNEEYRYAPDPIEQIKKYQKEFKIQKLLNFRGFYLKNKQERNVKKCVFFILSKLRMFKLIKRFI